MTTGQNEEQVFMPAPLLHLLNTLSHDFLYDLPKLHMIEQGILLLFPSGCNINSGILNFSYFDKYSVRSLFWP